MCGGRKNGPTQVEPVDADGNSAAANSKSPPMTGGDKKDVSQLGPAHIRLS